MPLITPLRESTRPFCISSFGGDPDWVKIDYSVPAIEASYDWGQLFWKY